MPHSELDETAKHSVYATVAGRTKQGKKAPLIQTTLVGWLRRACGCTSLNGVVS